MPEPVKKKRIRKKLNLRWTDSQREVLALYSQGKSFDDVVAAGFSKTMASRVRVGLNKGMRPKGWVEPLPQQSLELKTQTVLHKQPPPKKPAPHLGEPPPSAFETKYRIDTSEPVTIGAIQVLPEDWRISQHGFFLIMDTYHLTKEEIGYDGTVGKFIVDVFRFYRQFMQYAVLPVVGPGIIEQKQQEVSDNGRGEEADRGAGILEEGGGGGVEEAVWENGETDA